MIEIKRGGEVVSRSQNLRGILRYAGKHGVTYVNITRVSPGLARLVVVFNDGAEVTAPFADYIVLTRWVLARRSWGLGDWLVQLEHWPDRRTWSLIGYEKDVSGTDADDSL